MLDLQALFNVRGLTAVITGGSGQLGRTMAQALAQTGVQVAVVSLHAETAGTLAEAIQASGGQALGIACDVLNRAALEQTLEQVKKGVPDDNRRIIPCTATVDQG